MSLDNIIETNVEEFIKLAAVGRSYGFVVSGCSITGFA